MMQPAKPFNRTDHHPFKVCSNFRCPICVKSAAMFKVSKKLNKNLLFVNSPAPFVGRQGYPYVNVGVLSPPELTVDAWVYDAPSYWAENQFQIPQIVGYRSYLINSHSKSYVKGGNKLSDISEEVGMASSPVELELLLKNRPVIKMTADSVSAPLGPTAELASAKITSNPKIPTKVDKVNSDTDLKAADALNYLYKSGFDENFLSKVFSVGAIGLKTNRKLVPTRNSITAVDDTLGKQIISKIRDHPIIDTYTFYFDGYLGNYFAVMLFPEVWSYELFETLATHTDFTTDYEGYKGRKYYVQETAGGYFASRIPIVQKLNLLNRQASVLVIRVITEDYTVPLGVWCVRQSTIKAMKSKPIKFSNSKDMLTYVRNFLFSKFKHDVKSLFESSKLLKNISTQQKLVNY